MTPELFYVLDLGDWFAHGLSKVIQPTLAGVVGHLMSFAVNAGIWLGFIAVAARVI